MRATRKILLVWIIVLTATAFMVQLQSSADRSTLLREREEQALATAEASLRAVQIKSPAAEPLSRDETPVAYSIPVQTVGERNDAMLFESEALYGTPFDRAVVMPFD